MRQFQTKKVRLILGGVTLYWLAWVTSGLSLSTSTGVSIPYLLVGIAGLFCLHKNQETHAEPERFPRICLGVGAAFFALAVTLANYKSFHNSTLMVVFCLISSWMVMYEIFLFIYRLPISTKLYRYRYKPITVWLFCTGIIAAVYLFVFFTSYYPGILSPDSLGQVHQILTGTYSNHHPYYHTQIIHVMLKLGMELFGDINHAVGLYHVFQIFAMAAIFSYVLVTLYQSHIRFLWVGLCLAWYALMPFHVYYSFTMWKDVLWGGMVAVFVTALYRRLFDVGKRVFLNNGALLVSGVCVCLLRSNGWFAFAVMTVLFPLFFGKKYGKLMLLFLVVLVGSWVLKNPVLEKLGVTQPDTIESLSIPAQQIARVVVEGGNLTESEQALLSQIVDIESIPKVYKDYISDPIKALVREKENQHLITEQSLDYIKLWIRLGLRYPKLYIQAWTDQTKGYWNGGYYYWIWEGKIYDNEYGIYSHMAIPAIREVWNRYDSLYLYDPAVRIFICIGFHVWLVAGAFVISLARGWKRTAFLAVPLLTIILSLMVATPVYCEFRYAYAIFTSLPIVLFAACAGSDNQKTTIEKL